MKTRSAVTLESVSPAFCRPRSRVARYAPWLLVVVGTAVFANSLGAPFVFDDTGIPGRSHLRTLWPPWGAIFAPRDLPDSGRPVVTLSLQLNYALGGTDVRGYHALNIAVHVLASLVLYGIVRRTLRGPALSDRFENSADGIALVTALLWLVHPLQTECIGYVSQRSESIMGLFYLLTLYCAIRAAHAARPWRWNSAAIVACALGMASKEVMVTAPLMVAFYDWAFRREPFSAVWRRRWPLYAGLAATWIILAALMAAGPRTRSVGWHLGVGPLSYALNQCLIIPHYLRLIFWPHPLILDYGQVRQIPVATALPYAIGLAVVLLVVVVLCWRRPRLGYAAAWVFVIVAPTSSIVPIASEVGAERRMYLPLAGVIVLVVLAVHALLQRAETRKSKAGLSKHAGPAIAVAVTIILAATAIARNQAYYYPEDLWAAAIEAYPRNKRAYFCHGLVLERRGQRDEAIQSYQKALALAPGYYEANYALANALLEQGRLADAISYYRAALAAARRPVDRAPVCNDLGRVLLMAGEPKEALQLWREAAGLKPDEAGLLNNLAWQLATHPDPTIRDGREAVVLAERACELTAHRDPNILDTLAAAYAEAGRFPEAVETARAACALFAGTEAAEARARLELYLQSTPYRAAVPSEN